MGNFLSDIWNDLTGKSAAKELKKAQQEQTASSQAAIDKQLEWEKEKQGRMNQQQDYITNLAKEMLFGAPGSAPGEYKQVPTPGLPGQYPGGATMTPGGSGMGQMGFMPQAQQWAQKYFKNLEEAPDLEYNAERGAIARGTSQAQDSAAKAMRARGLNMMGLGALPFGDIAVKKAGLMGETERRREQRKGQNIEAGTQFSQNLLNQWLNTLMSAYSMPQLGSTQVPGMMMNQANQGFNTAMMQQQLGNPLAESLGNLGSSWVMDMMTKGKNGGSTPANMMTKGKNGGSTPANMFSMPQYSQPTNPLKSGFTAIAGANGIQLPF